MPKSIERFDAESVRACWDRAADIYAKGQASGVDYYRYDFFGPAQLAMCGEVRGLSILDVGCGNGYFSRALARLGARRVSRPEGGTVYELDGAAERNGLGALRGLVQEISANASLVVVRTHPGSAPAIARAIDLGEVPEVLGTIAGDDTIFVAPAPEIRPRRLAARLAEILGTPRALQGGARAH